MLLRTLAPGALAMVVAGLATLLPWRALPPRAALRALTGTVAALAAIVVVALGVVSTNFLLTTPAGDAAAAACSLFTGHHQVPAVAGIAASVALAVTARRVSRVWRSRGIDPAGHLPGPLAIVDEPRPVAYAEAGRHGTVVVSTGMLDSLRPDERRVLFAHEHAHVDQRHDRFVLAARMGAAVVPGLRRCVDEVELAAERCADEAAVAAVRGDRRLVARAIARAALAADGFPAGGHGLAFGGGTVPFRVQTLIDPTRARAARTRSAMALALLLASGTTAAVVFSHHIAELIAHLCR